MLQKQTPASTIPRFNPHGYQAPPQEKKKDNDMGGSPLKKTFGNKRKVEKEEIVDFKKFNIEDLLNDLVSYKFKFNI